MSEQHLTAVSRTQGNNRALKAGEVTPSRYRLDFEEIPVIVQAFRRMVRGLEWDVSEMAFSTYLCAKEHGVAFTALPIFLVRGFHHGAIVVNAKAGIRHPKELEGRRVGVNRGYTVTTGVWARGILRDEYGVNLDAVTWVPTGDEHVAAYQPPANVSPLAGGGNLAELVAAGEVDAAVGITADQPGVAPLIPDADEAGYAAEIVERLELTRLASGLTMAEGGAAPHEIRSSDHVTVFVTDREGLSAMGTVPDPRTNPDAWPWTGQEDDDD
jgi:4,5-dihydroxyphthalate decarboxylase